MKIGLFTEPPCQNVVKCAEIVCGDSISLYAVSILLGHLTTGTNIPDR